MKRQVRSLLIASIMCFMPCVSHAKSDKETLQQIKCLQKAYPAYIKSVQMSPDITFEMTAGKNIRWNDGIKKTLKQKYESADLKDMLSLPYPAFSDVNLQPAQDYDPGRFRNYAFLGAVYGDSKAAVTDNLVPVAWLPYAGGNKLLFNRQNGAAQALEQVVRELQQLPEKYRNFLQHPGGTFIYRVIAGTNLSSAHSYGIAIDLNPQYGNYWRDSKENLNGSSILHKNKMPKEIVDIFERHGFIWGGRWYHYDTEHFEYRPEFFCQTVNAS